MGEVAGPGRQGVACTGMATGRASGAILGNRVGRLGRPAQQAGQGPWVDPRRRRAEDLGGT
ncbi:hypothetical protein C6W10_36990 [Plantactinospora sp. BB1]|nr:hypothetical protein C6W10_36990 [Plantactinospora sp. BB1]